MRPTVLALLLMVRPRHRRKLPWRPLPGERADPYGVWRVKIMLQQTSVKTVGTAIGFLKFLALRAGRMSMRSDRASLDEVLADVGYGNLPAITPARAIFMPARSRCATDHGGVFPDTEQGLRALPGIGPYTAAAIAAIAFGRQTMPVDGNIERVVSRLSRSRNRCRRPSR